MSERQPQNQEVRSYEERKQDLMEKASDFWAQVQKREKMYWSTGENGVEELSSSRGIVQEVRGKITELLQELFPDLDTVAKREEMLKEIHPDLQKMTIEKIKEMNKQEGNS